MNKHKIKYEISGNRCVIKGDNLSTSEIITLVKFSIEKTKLHLGRRVLTIEHFRNPGDPTPDHIKITYYCRRPVGTQTIYRQSYDMPVGYPFSERTLELTKPILRNIKIKDLLEWKNISQAQASNKGKEFYLW